jgi:hypothetical protein
VFTFTESTGHLGLNGGFFSSDGGKLIVKLADAACQSDRLGFVSSGHSQYKAIGNDLEVLLTLHEEGTIDIQVKNISSRQLRVEDIAIEFPPSTFSPSLQAREYRHLIHSRDFETLCHVKAVHLQTPWTEANPESGMVTVYSHVETGNALLIGTLPPFGSGFGHISTIHKQLHMEGTFGIKIRFDFQQSLDPGSELRTSPVVCLEGVGGEELLEKYADLIRSRLARPKKPLATGWNSWDYYAGAITRTDMDENLAAVKKNFGDKVKYIVIDEGWECMWGVWQPNWKFSEGLEDFCRHVRASGHAPGIWTAPLMVNYYTPLYRNHPDWFVSRADGNVHLVNLSYGTMAQLDITHPEVRDHLRQVYTNLRQCGFEYFKVDFTQMILDAERFHDPRVGRAEVIRSVFKLIRECIGEECYLLACGAPYESVIGIVDACRTSADIHNHWGMIVQNIHCIFGRWWMQGSIGNTDPDFLIVRNSETTDDRQLNRRIPVIPRARSMHWTDGAEMNLEESKVLALAVHLSGGDAVLGDAIDKLNATGIDILNKVISPLNAPARPLNLFDPQGNSYPVMLAKSEDEFLLGVFNLTDDAVTRTIDLSILNESTPARAFDFWTNEAVEIADQIQLFLPPRSAKGLKIPRQKE